MDSEITFGAWGTIALLINTICARIFLNFPRQVIETSGTAAWITVLYVIALITLLFTFIQRLYAPFEGKDLLDISEESLGNIARIMVGILIILLLLYVGSVILREYSENIKTISLIQSPISFVTLFFLAGMICGAYLGIEALARFHDLAVPFVVITFLFIIIAVIPYYDFTNFAPWLGTGAAHIFGKGSLSISLFAPMLYLFLVPPFIKTHKNFKKCGYIAIAFSGFFLLCSTIAYTAVYPYPTSTESFLPTFQLARLINYGRFFQRIESLFLLAWATSALMYLSIILFFTSYVFKKTFKLEYYRPLVFIFATIIFILSLLPPNLMTAIKMETKYYGSFSWVIALAMPLLILCIANLKKKAQGR